MQNRFQKMEQKIREESKPLIEHYVKQLQEPGESNYKKSMKQKLEKLHSNIEKKILDYQRSLVKRNNFGTSANSQFSHPVGQDEGFVFGGPAQTRTNSQLSHPVKQDKKFVFGGPAPNFVNLGHSQQNYPEEFTEFYVFVLNKANSHNISKVSNTKYIIHYSNNHRAIWELKLSEDGKKLNKFETHEYNLDSNLNHHNV